VDHKKVQPTPTLSNRLLSNGPLRLRQCGGLRMRTMQVMHSEIGFIACW
jgi:hypothetical protein